MSKEIKIELDENEKITEKYTNEVNAIMKKYNCRFDPEFYISGSGVQTRVLIKENIK
jgi:hypothetical protein